ncbi:Potassium voltage-gated channel subfamily B member 1, partial [Cichlidogyrus casuarinus]
IWKGVPYAQPPTRERNRRFRRPLKLEHSNERVDATRFRSICAQPLMGRNSSAWTSFPYEWIRRMPPQMDPEVETVDEDCLYMNIYASTESMKRSPAMQLRLPIIVFFSSYDHVNGNPSSFPGHLLSQLGLVVITVQHRLGPFGYLSTQQDSGHNIPPDDETDDYALGNYALWDQILALQFIQENAHHFYGDKDQVTLMGHGSAGADMTAHIFSPYSGLAATPLLHRVILIDGSGDMEGGMASAQEEAFFDWSRWSLFQTAEQPQASGMAYAMQLALNVGCDIQSARNMLNCLRMRSWHEIAAVSTSLDVHRPGWARTRPWTLNIDGQLIPGKLDKLWHEGRFAQIPLMGILSTEEAAFHAVADLCKLPSTRSKMPPFAFTTDDIFKAFEEQARGDFARDPVEVAKTLLHTYTRAKDLNPKEPAWWNLVHAYTDRRTGNGLVRTLIRHSSSQLLDANRGKDVKNQTTFMVFPYASEMDPWARELGAYGGSVLQYIFGFPRFFFNIWQSELDADRWRMELGLVPMDQFQYDYARDLNISDYMMSLVSNFAIKGNATPSPVRNVTWDTFRPDNQTYLLVNLTGMYNWSTSNRVDWQMEQLGAGFDLRQNYRTQMYAFWWAIYFNLLDRYPRFKLPQPISLYLERYRYATITMATMIFISILAVLGLAILIHNKRRMLTVARHRL